MEKVGVEGLVLNLATNVPVLILKGKGGRILPIEIGVFEAQAILVVLEKASIARPLTHDLIKNILDTFEAEFLRTEIHSIREGVYYANLVLKIDGNTQKIDCRPSDGIAVALRFNGNIMVEAGLMKNAEIVSDKKNSKFFKAGTPDKPIDRKEAEELRKTIEEIKPEEFWKEIKGE